jgi:hypothetical protein
MQMKPEKSISNISVAFFDETGEVESGTHVPCSQEAK